MSCTIRNVHQAKHFQQYFATMYADTVRVIMCNKVPSQHGVRRRQITYILTLLLCKTSSHNPIFVNNNSNETVHSDTQTPLLRRRCNISCTKIYANFAKFETFSGLHNTKYTCKEAAIMSSYENIYSDDASSAILF